MAKARTAHMVDGRDCDVVPIDDRGLAFGDGLFETMAVHDGQVRFVQRHLDRLESGCRRLAIAPVERALLAGEIQALSSGHQRAVLKLIVTRGSGGRGYDAPKHAASRRVLSLSAWPPFDKERYRDGIHVAVCRSRLGSSRALAGLKTLNRLEQVLARQEICARGLDEGLLLDEVDRVIEASAANLFVVHRDRVTTPLLDRCGVAGVMRAAVIQALAATGCRVEEGIVRQSDLGTADEMFLTNAIAGIVPIGRCGARRLGPFTLAAMLSRSMAADGVSPCG